MIEQNLYAARHLIGGRLAESDRRGEVFNPVTGDICGFYSKAYPRQAEEALAAAKQAAGEWRRTPLAQRESCILDLKARILSEGESLRALLRIETGMTEANARYDLGMLTDCLSHFVEEIQHRHGEIIPDASGYWHHELMAQPVGVVVAFLSWNFPLLNLGYKLGPMLATGCKGVIKPSSQAPLTTARIGEIALESALPKGVLNILCGKSDELGPVLARSPIPRLLTMIGSTRGGLALVSASATSVKRFSLELGGNAPAIVWQDADVPAAVSTLVNLKFNNAGQVCVSPNRVFVHEKVREAFLSGAKKIAESYRPVDALGEGPFIQPVRSERSLTRILGKVDEALRLGAIVVCGGKRIDRPGYFIAPTLLDRVPRDCALCREEIFGPVMPVIPFGDETDILEQANDTDAGLAAYVFTRDQNRIQEAQERLDAGSILVNGSTYQIRLPHGGLKQSGYGKDVSHLCLDDYLDVKRISIHRGKNGGA